MPPRKSLYKTVRCLEEDAEKKLNDMPADYRLHSVNVIQGIGYSVRTEVLMVFIKIGDSK